MKEKILDIIGIICIGSLFAFFIVMGIQNWDDTPNPVTDDEIQSELNYGIDK